MIILKKLAKSLDVNHTALYNSSVRKNCDVWQGIEREPQPRICGSDLPGCGPLVSFETSVGKTLEPGGVIDADIEAIYETAAAVGLNEREMDGVEIVFASRKHSEILPSGCSGYYQYQNGDGIVLKLDAIRTRQRPLAMSCSIWLTSKVVFCTKTIGRLY